MTDTYALDEAILDAELRYINYFNGRLLSAEDLSQEQSVNRARARHLGKALGSGVAGGLEVSVAPGSNAAQGLVQIAAGLAVNAAGQTLRLACNETIALIQTLDPSRASECLFSDCEPLAAGATASSQGYYLLTIAPASKSEGLAPVSGLGSRLANCNSKYYAEGVKFRFLQLRVSASGNTARNTIAYECFGHPLVDGLLMAALGSSPETKYGLSTLTASGDLTDEDVPLAIVEWKASGELGFIDMWSVRRRIIQPAVAGRWNYFVGDRRLAENEAMFLQFQEHTRALQTQGSAAAIAAADYFRFLPALGVLLVGGTGSTAAFSATPFFGAHASDDVAMLDAGQFRSLLDESLRYEPVRLDQAGKLQLYFIWESVLALEAGTGSRLAMVFASPALPYRGTARFGHAKSNLSRFSSFIL
jgi:hypothetical protein